MLLKKALLSQENLNNAFLSKTDINAQVMQSSLTLSGGMLTLKNSVLTDNVSSGYLRIDPQGNSVIIYDGVNNQTFSVYSSSGSESTYVTTINQASNQSYGLIDVGGASVDHLEINTNSNKHIRIAPAGIQWGKSATATDNFHIVNDTSGGTRGIRIYNGNYGAGAQKLSILQNGHVGINTLGPGYWANASQVLVSVKGNAQAGVFEMLTAATDADGQALGHLQFTDINSLSADKRAAVIVGTVDGATANNRGGSLRFFTKPDGTSGTLERMRIDRNGYVGIGVVPTQALDLVGNFKLTGTILVPSTAGGRTIQGSSANYTLMLQSHGSGTWLRNELGRLVFQSGVAGDNWTETGEIYFPVVTSAADLSTYMEFGQRSSNVATGKYRGVRITQYSGSALLDGDLRAGIIYATKGFVLPVGTNAYVTKSA